MGKMQDALGRLEAAVARLEQASRRKSDGAAGHDGVAHHGGVAQADYDALATVTGEVAARLDAVIGRLDSVLEG